MDDWSVQDASRRTAVVIDRSSLRPPSKPNWKFLQRTQYTVFIVRSTRSNDANVTYQIRCSTTLLFTSIDRESKL